MTKSMNQPRTIPRRELLKRCGMGLPMLAGSAMLSEDAVASNNPLAPQQPHHEAKAKHVVHLFTVSYTHLTLPTKRIV